VNGGGRRTSRWAGHRTSRMMPPDRQATASRRRLHQRAFSGDVEDGVFPAICPVPIKLEAYFLYG